MLKLKENVHMHVHHHDLHTLFIALYEYALYAIHNFRLVKRKLKSPGWADIKPCTVLLSVADES